MWDEGQVERKKNKMTHIVIKTKRPPALLVVSAQDDGGASRLYRPGENEERGRKEKME